MCVPLKIYHFINRVSNLAANQRHNQYSGKVHNCRHENGCFWSHRACRNNCRNCIGSICPAVNKYNTKHSEAIITEDIRNAEYFQKNIDAAAVYVNASTRFTDGGEFGLGCEMGISTQKLHARGPMGLEELTSSKYVIYGEGQVR